MIDKALYEKLGVISSKATNGFFVYERKGVKVNIDRPCKIGDIVVKLKNSGMFGKVSVIPVEEWDKKEKDSLGDQSINESNLLAVGA